MWTFSKFVIPTEARNLQCADRTNCRFLAVLGMTKA